MELVQWFFTLWLLGVPYEVGPYVNEIQCDNMRAAMLERMAKANRIPDNAPVCVEKRFAIIKP